MAEDQNTTPTPADDSLGTAMDAANQSLADALKSSFRILKTLMFILLIVYLCSGIKMVDNRERAVIFRFGELVLDEGGQPFGPGFLWAWPFPIDEVVCLPTEQLSKDEVKSHWFQVSKKNLDKSIGELARSAPQGLDPVLDGALLTSDSGLVHIKWIVNYKVTNLKDYVLNVASTLGATLGKSKEQELTHALLENAAIHVASKYTATEITRSKTGQVGEEVRMLLNESLEELGTGIRVDSLEIEPQVPLQTVKAFDAVVNADTQRASLEREAENKAQAILNKAAGESHGKLLKKLYAMDEARLAGDSTKLEEIENQIERMLEFEVSGEAGSKVRQARSFYTEAVKRIEGDLDEYNSVKDEYLRNPELLVTRLWQRTKQRIMTTRGVNKWFIPENMYEVRINTSDLDPKQREKDERERLAKEAEMMKNAKMIMVP